MMAAFLILGGVAALTSRPHGLGAAVDQRSEDCAVLTAVLRDRFERANSTIMGVNQLTMGTLGWTRGDFIAEAAQTLPIATDLWANYRVRNAETNKLEAACFLDVESVRVGHRDDFGESHYVSFSQVGFSADMNYALVHTLYSCGSRCGNGELLLLAKEGGVWVVRQRTRTVVM